MISPVTDAGESNRTAMQVLQHPERETIDRELIAGTSLASLSSRSGITKQPLR